MKYRNILLAAVVAALAGVASEANAGLGLKRPAVAGGPFTLPVPAAVQTRADMVLQDGGFEASYKPATEDYLVNDFWSGFSTNYGTPFCNFDVCGGYGEPNNGTFWTWFASGAVAETTSVEQTVLIPDVPGADSTALSFYLAVPDCEAQEYSFTVTVDDTQVWGFDQSTPPAGCGSLDYVPVYVDISGFADGSSHALEFAANMARGATNIYIDDVAIIAGQYSYFRLGQAVDLPPPGTDCDSTTPNPDHFGRMIVDKNTGALWMCTDSGWQTDATTSVRIDELDTSEVYRYFRPGQAGLPLADADCDSTTPNTNHFGRMIVDESTGDLWVCTDAGWQTSGWSASGYAADVYLDEEVVSGYSYFRPGQAVNLPPPAADCDTGTPNTDHFGRMIADKNTGALWMCTDGGWQKTMGTAP